MWTVVPDFKNKRGEWVKTKGPAGNRLKTRSYNIWQTMMYRCKEGNKMAQKYPSYIGCKVSVMFSNFQLFTDWCHLQRGYLTDGFQLDKDLLMEGNKLYSENTCVFVPNAINSLFLSHDKRRGDLPQGVIYELSRKRYRAQMSYGDSCAKFIGYYDTIEEASAAYAEQKTEFVRSQANKYREFIDERLYNKLVNFKFKGSKQ